MFGNKEKDRPVANPTASTSTPTAPPAPSAPQHAASQPDRTVLGEGAKFTGNLTVHGSVVVNGDFEGSLNCTESLIVGKSGNVKAEIEVRYAHVAGRVEGRIQARELVELETGSHLEGDVHAKSFMIQDGVFFQGNCSMGEAATVPPKPVEPVGEERAPELGILKQS